MVWPGSLYTGWFRLAGLGFRGLGFRGLGSQALGALGHCLFGGLLLGEPRVPLAGRVRYFPEAPESRRCSFGFPTLAIKTLNQKPRSRYEGP